LANCFSWDAGPNQLPHSVDSESGEDLMGGWACRFLQWRSSQRNGRFNRSATVPAWYWHAQAKAGEINLFLERERIRPTYNTYEKR